jgi:hypothetical protein
MLIRIAYVVCALLLPVAVHAQTNSTVLPLKTELALIDSYTAEIDRFIKLQRGERIFADISADEKSRWREFKSDAARQQADTGDNLNDNALLWTRKAKVVGANFTFQSPSRDWAHFVMYYYREDGTLAKIDARLNTFYGDLSVVRKRYYDSHGKLIKSTLKYLDLHTQKPTKPTGDFFDEPIPVYRKVSELPFQNLL